MDEFEEAWKENRHVWESTKNLAKAMYLAGQQSRQAEVDQLKGLLEKDEYAHNLYYENANLQTLVEEKDKRIESALYVLKGLKAENDLWGCDQVEVQIEILEKALRGAND
ncbi:hypothetical protein [Acinetobacter sp. P8-3-8]|uniref:hypothetical protein n=1 Tax=Acinetobacter sp. P8-3-8 TaxID=1029823 RepID=UPI000248659D|nr:hypothetical protein [Acinetobacter sp. P8-3-8]